MNFQIPINFIRKIQWNKGVLKIPVHKFECALTIIKAFFRALSLLVHNLLVDYISTFLSVISAKFLVKPTIIFDFREHLILESK